MCGSPCNPLTRRPARRRLAESWISSSPTTCCCLPPISRIGSLTGRRCCPAAWPRSSNARSWSTTPLPPIPVLGGPHEPRRPPAPRPHHRERGRPGLGRKDPPQDHRRRRASRAALARRLEALPVAALVGAFPDLGWPAPQRHEL